MPLFGHRHEMATDLQVTDQTIHITMANEAMNTIAIELYTGSAKEPKLLRIPAMKFLMIDGKGDPNTSAEFQTSIQALYTLAYTIKFGRKKRGEESNYKIPPF